MFKKKVCASTMEYKRVTNFSNLINRANASTCWKVVLKFAFYASLISLSIMVASIPNIIRTTRKYQMTRRHLRHPPDLRYVLLWTPNQPKPMEDGQNMFIENKCEFINCYLTYNKTLLRNDQSNFDALVFNSHDLRYSNTARSMRRYPNQKYIFRSSVAPQRYPVCDPIFDNFFNWTWTYKLNSDIPSPFLKVYNTEKQHIGPKINMDWIQNMSHNNTAVETSIKNKKKAVAWIISSCNVKDAGKEFVNDLRKELVGYNYTVDEFGACSARKCPEGRRWKCLQMIEKEYYFSLVVESHLAEDYVSAEILKTLTHKTVPLVYGGANYSRFFPPGSYVNAREHGLYHLGAIINYLIKYPKVYKRFLDWRNHYYYTEVTPGDRSDVCDLCKMLNDDSRMARPETREDFRNWWNPSLEDDCQSWLLMNKVKEH